ncbi:MAG: hypothetical protein EXR76_07720 [Myxococcales bacterium]|nr:hypothetical protein [Myxococcales bacterium]
MVEKPDTAVQADLFDEPTSLPREQGLRQLRTLVSRDLRALARLYGINVDVGGKRNKGWAGHVVERFLGRSPDSVQAPDFGDWELKVIPLVERADGRLRPKESMSITMFDAADLESQDFESSHLRQKLARLVIVTRLYVDATESRSPVLHVVPFDLTGRADPSLEAEIKADYEEIRWVARTSGLEALTAHIGRHVQPRPKGMAHHRAGFGFYARASLVYRLLKGAPA